MKAGKSVCRTLWVFIGIPSTSLKEQQFVIQVWYLIRESLRDPKDVISSDNMNVDALARQTAAVLQLNFIFAHRKL